MKYLIVNGDDFGQSPGVNRGIIQAYEQGILTSASLMVRWPAAAEAAEYARRHSELSVGLHLDLGEWNYTNGAWVRLYQVVDERDPDAVSAEITSQWSAFERLTGRFPTHLDSHQHVHRSPPARMAVIELAGRFDIPVRDITRSIQYCGRFYGQDDRGVEYPEGIGVDGLLGILGALPPGATELGCHPAAAADLDTMYGVERLTELSTLCDERVRKAIVQMGIELRSFANWRSFADTRD